MPGLAIDLGDVDTSLADMQAITANTRTFASAMSPRSIIQPFGV